MIVEPISNDDFNVTARALYGSYERMTSHPNWIECKAKSDYLGKLMDNLHRGFEKEISEVHPLNIPKLIFGKASLWLMKKFVIPEIDMLKKRYDAQLKLPIGFVVAGVNEDFDKYIEDNRKMIITLNNSLNIKDDPYV